MATTNMFTLLDDVSRLIAEKNPDEAYSLIEDVLDNDPDGYAKRFISDWFQHHLSEEEATRGDFAEIILYLREDYPEVTGQGDATEGDSVLVYATETAAVLEDEPVPDDSTKEESKEDFPPEDEEEEQADEGTEQKPETDEREHITLTFYDWQKAAIARAARKQGLDENALLTTILESGDAKPLAFARYRPGESSSPDQRLTITVPHRTKETIESQKNSEGIKTTTKYVRRLLFGNRAEKS